MAHHPFSPSKLERLEACPGSYALAQEIEAPVSAEAEEGTELHRHVSDDAHLAELSEDQKEMVGKCRAFRDRLREKHPELGIWQEEAPLKLLLNFEVLTEGTADLVGYAPEYVVVVDWKFGFKAVTEAEKNLQVRTYAAAAMQAAKKPRAYVYVFQARTGKHTEAVMEMEAYSAIVARVDDIRHACQVNRMLLIPSDNACEYCPAKPLCPAMKRKAGDLAKLHSSQLTDPEFMGKLLSFAKLVKKWADSVEYHAKALALRHNGLPGFQLRARKGNRSINDAQKAYDLLCALFTPQEFMAACSVDVGALEEAYVKKRKAMDTKITLSKAKGEFETLLLPVIERAAEVQTLVSA